MLQIIRNNSPYTVIILFIFTLLVKLQALSHPLPPMVAENHVLFGSVVSLLDVVFRGNAFAYALFTVIMLFGQAIYLNATFVKHKLLDKPTYAVAYVYIILTSLLPAYNYFNEIVLVNWCMIAGIDFGFSLHQNNQPRKQIFNTGFVVSLSALIHFQAVVFILLVLAAILFLRSFNLAEWMVAIMGCLTPVYMYACILFLCNRLNVQSFGYNIGLSLPRHINSPGYLIGSIIGILVLAACGIYAAQSSIYKAGIYNRRMWTNIYIYLFLSIIAAVFTDISEKSVWLLISPALSLIIAPALIIEKTKWFSNFAFYFSLVFVLYCQWLVN